MLQEDAVALENHIWRAVDHQRALGRLKAYGVAKLPAIGRHLAETRREEKLVSAQVDSGKVFHPYDTVGGKSQDAHVGPDGGFKSKGSKEARCVDKCSLFTQHVEA